MKDPKDTVKLKHYLIVHLRCFAAACHPFQYFGVYFVNYVLLHFISLQRTNFTKNHVNLSQVLPIPQIG